MTEEKLMTQAEARDAYYRNGVKGTQRPNKFAKDTIKKKNTDYYSFWRSAFSQIDYQIEELKRKSREEEAKKRAEKKKKKEVEVVG